MSPQRLDNDFLGIVKAVNNQAVFHRAGRHYNNVESAGCRIAAIEDGSARCFTFWCCFLVRIVGIAKERRLLASTIGCQLPTIRFNFTRGVLPMDWELST